MIRIKRLAEFFSELVKIRNEELTEKAQWEFWLHKDFERSFDEFLGAGKPNDTISASELEELMNQTREMFSSERG